MISHDDWDNDQKNLNIVNMSVLSVGPTAKNNNNKQSNNSYSEGYNA
jgi:hypothetical protein